MNAHRFISKLQAIALTTALSCYPCLVPAAIETTDSEAMRSRARQEALERERLQQQPSVNLQSEVPEVKSVPFPTSETPCFTLHQFSFNIPEQLSPEAHRLGGSTLPLSTFRFAQNYLEQFAGYCVGREGINHIVRGVTTLILDHGYATTRVLIPEQDLSGGTLKLTLMPGLIHALRFEDESTRGTWKNAFPTRAGKLLNLRDLEQGLEQMKRVMSQEVDMQIVPAGKTGESDVVISIKRGKPWRLTATLDDTGAKGTGTLQAGLQLGLDNLLGISDTLNLGINSDAERRSYLRGTQGGNISYSVPFGYWTTSMSINESSYHQRVAGAVNSFVSSGKSQNLEFKLGWLFQRDQFRKNTLQFRTAKRLSHAYIDDTEIDVQKRNLTMAEVAWIHKHNIGEAQLDSTLVYRWGAPWFGAQDEASGIPANQPRYRYALQTLDISLTLPFKVKAQTLTYSATLRAQNTHTALYASEWFAIGNRWSVRGFDGESALSAEKGYYLRNEIGIPVPGTAQSIFMGMDFGQVYGENVHNLLGNKLAGLSTGVRGSLAKGLTYELLVGIPLNAPHNFPSADPAAGFSLMYQL